MNRLLQHFAADQDANGGGSDWASQRAQEETTQTPTPFAAAPAQTQTPPPFEDVPLSSSTTGAKYDTVDLFDDGPAKSSAAFPAAPAASETPRDAPVHDFFGSSQPAHDPFAVAQAHENRPFAAAPQHQNSPFGSVAEHQSSPFGSVAEHQSNPFGSVVEHQNSSFASAPQHQQELFSSAPQQQDPFSSTPPQQHDPFSSTPKQQQSPFDSAPEQQAIPFSSASEPQSSPFGSTTEQQPSPFGSATTEQSHDPFAATPEQYPQAHEQQYYQGHDQYAQHQYDSNGYDYYQQHDQQQYYDQYQQQQYGGDQGYGGQYQYSAEEYQYYQAQNGGEHAEAAASVFGQQEYHQQGYGYGEAAVPAGSAPAAQEAPVPSADSFFQSTEQPPVSSGSPFAQSASDPFAQPSANAADSFRQHPQHSPFGQESAASVAAIANGNQGESELHAPVQDFFSSNDTGHADASSLFSSSTATEEVHSDSLFGSPHSPVQASSAPSPASHHVQTPPPAPVTAPAPAAVPVAPPVLVEDKTSQLQGAFASLGISCQERENPADGPEQSTEHTAQTKARATSSTLDDTMRLAEMYKQMAERLQTEKNDLLKVLADQTDQFYQMQDYIHSLEREVEEYRSKEMGA